MKTILAALLILFAALGAGAQNPIRVVVGKGDAVDEKIAAQLKAKIGGTSRYEASDYSPEVPLAVDVSCVELRQESGGMRGYACHSMVTYFPDMGALSVHLPRAETLVICDTRGEDCAEALFEAFVNGTQPDKLAKEKAEFTTYIDQYIRLRDAMNQLRQQSKQPQK